MRKCLLLALLLLQVLPASVRAQNTLFELETDTVCVGQEVRIRPQVMNADSYYWGFCSGYLNNTPQAENLGSSFSFNEPSGIVLEKDDNGNFYGFVVNTGNTELIRLNYGKSLSNTPTVTNFGNLDDAVSPGPVSLYLTRDSGKWYLFMCGGTGGAATSTLSRFDFGATLANKPNGVRMGNPGNLMNDPRGIFVAKQGPVYYGFVVNTADNRLIRFNFGNNISRTPTANVVTFASTGNQGGLSQPRDIAAVFYQGNWYFFIPNTYPPNPPANVNGGATISRLSFGASLSNNPAAALATGASSISTGGPNPQTTRLSGPTSISITRDCGGWYAYVANNGLPSPDPDSVLRFNVPSISGSWSFNTAYANTGTFNEPTDISNVIRDRDSVYFFVTNKGDNSLSRALFPQCTKADRPSSNLAQPPVFHYDTAGIYNINLIVNEGRPNMQTECKQIFVRHVPPLIMQHDTLICLGDTVHLQVASQYALDYFFSPNYNLTDTQGINIYAYPRQTTNYLVRIPFPDGCVVDTNIRIDVSNVFADAGPDRTIADGGKTVIGGANTYLGSQYSYQWFPTDFMDNPFSLNPTVNPRNNFTYYLQVTNTLGCVDIDTVNVRVVCSGINLPNAFVPQSSRGESTRFGLINKQIVKLNYFRIFDRWGKEMFSTTDPNKGWDGNYNGNPAPFGVYVWEVDGYCELGDRFTKSGNVTLIR